MPDSHASRGLFISSRITQQVMAFGPRPAGPNRKAVVIKLGLSLLHLIDIKKCHSLQTASVGNSSDECSYRSGPTGL